VIVVSLVICLATWYVIERTKLGSYLRAATENRPRAAFGINVPRMITLTYGSASALAAFAGVMAAPIYQVSPQMGANLIIVVFAVVVIGGMGSIWRDPDRLRPRCGRGPDQGVLSRGVEHGDLRDHGRRADAKPPACSARSADGARRTRWSRPRRRGRPRRAGVGASGGDPSRRAVRDRDRT
jgi:hypothetical protein